MSKQKTPRTDAAAIGFARIMIEHGTPENPKFEMIEIIPADDARKLETDLAEAVAALREYRTKVPLGHQPHMMAHKVDEILAKHKLHWKRLWKTFGTLNAAPTLSA